MVEATWQSQGIDELRDVLAKVRVVADAALRDLGVADDDRPRFCIRVENALTCPIASLHREDAPTAGSRSKALSSVEKVASALQEQLNRLDGISRRALEAAAHPQTPRPELGELFDDGVLRLGEFLRHLAEARTWIASAQNLNGKGSAGRPQKEAIFTTVVALIPIFEEASGTTAGRNVGTYRGSRECGRFRQFANALMATFGVAVSDDMAKRALAEAHGGNPKI